MKKIKDDPLISIFKKSPNGEYVEEIDSIQNIPKFFEYIISEQTPEDSKIGVLENLLSILEKRRFIGEYFSSYKNKSIYLYLLDLYFSKSSVQMKSTIMKIINELVLFLETNKEVYEYIFQRISKIYNKEKTNIEKTPDNLFEHLTILETLLAYREKIPKPRNYFTLLGNNKLVLDLKEKSLKIGYCMTFILNFKLGNCIDTNVSSTLFNINFSNSSSVLFKIQSNGDLSVKEENGKEQLLKKIPPNEPVIFLVNIIVEENYYQVFNFLNGENNLRPIKFHKKVNIEKDTIDHMEFFGNFYGEVTSITMLIQKEKSNPVINSNKILPKFKQYFEGFYTRKKLLKFIDFLSETYTEGNCVSDMISSKCKLINNLVFTFTPFCYFHPSWDKNKNNSENDDYAKIDDYYNKHTMIILDTNNSVRNHRYQNYQKKLYLVCDITNFLPIAEMFLIHPQLLIEKNLILYLKIVEILINLRKRNVEALKECGFFKILCLFIEKYPNQIFTESILEAFLNIGKTMFQNFFEQLKNTYFKHILLNEKILSKYSKNLQIKFWNQLYLFCQSDEQQLESIIKMNRICLILRFYDKNKYNEICCKNHLDMFKKEFIENSNIMEPSMEVKLTDIWKIIKVIITYQSPDWVLSLFKLLTLDLSPCLTKFIIVAITKALIIHENDDKINKPEKKEGQNTFLDDIVVIPNKNSWLKEFIEEMSSNKYEIIITNTFIHSLPDVKYDILKLLYQIYQTLSSLDKKKDFKIFVDMMKKYILPQKMFYEKKDGKDVNVLNSDYLKQYYKDIIDLFINWSLNEKLINKDKKDGNDNDTNNDIYFDPNKKLDEKAEIKNVFILEVIFELIKRLNYDRELILHFFEITYTKNPSNCNKILYDSKIVLEFLNLVYECYKMKINDEGKDKDIEKCFSLGISIISNIYINDLLYRENKFIDEHYTFNEIYLIFLWGDKIIFKQNNSKNDLVKNEVFSFIGELLTKILSDFKLKIYPKMNQYSSDNIKQNFIKSYYHQNYLIFIYKLFEFSFEYKFDSLIKDKKINIEKIQDYNNKFLDAMRLKKNKMKLISLYWEDFHFFEEIYSKVNYMWKKEYLYKDCDNTKLKSKNKIEKYEYILNNLILNKNKRNLFKKELVFLTSLYVTQKEYNTFVETKDKDNNVNFSLMRQIQITLITIITLLLSILSEEDLLKWLKELKHYVTFLIIASTNIVINEKDKESIDSKVISYMNIQEQCLFSIYICLMFLSQSRFFADKCKKKIENTCISVFLLCFIILKNTYAYRKKKKITKAFTIGYKFSAEDLSGSSVFVLFNEYIKDKKKDNILLNLDTLNSILDKNNYSQNIIKLLDSANWKSCFDNNKNICELLKEKYYPLKEYNSIVEQRIKTINKIEEMSTKDNWNYSDEEILKLLPLYEKELVHYSNNSLEKSIKKKNLYKSIKKNLFSWRGFWSDQLLFYQEKINNNVNNDSFADKNNVSKIKYKLINHYTKSFMKPLLAPILDIHYYLPDFSGFNPDNIFINKEKFIVNMDIDKIVKIKEEQKTKEGKKENLKENYFRKIYIKSNPVLADKLLKISESLDLGKEEEFSFFKEEKDNEKNKENEEKKMNDEQENYFLSCLVKESHHIKGVCFVDEENLSFKVFLNQKTGSAMSGVNIGFTNEDEDYDEERKTCFGSYFMFHQKDKHVYKIKINYDDIKLILLKRYYYKNSALEIFTTRNKSYYFNFKYEKQRETFIKQILQKLKNAKPIINDLKESKDKDNILGYSVLHKKVKDKKKYTKKELEKQDKEEKKQSNIRLSQTIKDWSQWKINNFSFLMWMNFFGNRSYSDISQYPIFPWILSKYQDPLNIEHIYSETSLCAISDINGTPNSNREESNEFTINDSRSTSCVSENCVNKDNEKKKKKKKIGDEFDYRDLKKPMGMLEISEESIKRKNVFLDLYETLNSSRDEFEGTKPYYYGTNYSNPIYVCNFLMRLFPFTHTSIELQGNKIDDPNRLFLSVVKSFENSTTQKTDVRELIPEFFYLPEMFLNINDINLGKTEDNSIVYNVKTPCNNNAYAFIDVMKRIFENDFVSYFLSYWVDLIFGFKARGKEAENAKNIFTEASYQENINLNDLPRSDQTAQLRLVEFGLIPTQIMSKECQKRGKKKDIKKDKELTECNYEKIKVVSIKHNIANNKNMINQKGKKSKLLKVDIFNSDKIIMVYDNNTIIEEKIGATTEEICCTYKISPMNNKINEQYADKKNDKIIRFCNSCTTMIVGGFYDGRITIIDLEDKAEKNIEQIYPFSEEEPILSICIDKEETFMVLGNTLGNIAVYKINFENNKWELYKKIFHQMGPISDININSELNLFSTSSIDGFINLYTTPDCKLIRSIKVPTGENNDGQCNYVFLSESSLPSIIAIIENEKNCVIYSYSINGKYLNSIPVSKNLICPTKVRDLNSFEYLVYYIDTEINVINLPSLSLCITLKNIFNVKKLCVNEDLTAIFVISEDGTQIQAIKT